MVESIKRHAPPHVRAEFNEALDAYMDIWLRGIHKHLDTLTKPPVQKGDEEPIESTLISTPATDV
jgi:hypothetical protein